MSIRFQADNDLNNLIVAATFRREPSIDFRMARTARLDHLDDEAVLRLAASEISGRCRGNSQRFLREGNHSPGVLIVIPQGAPLRVVVDTLVLIWTDDTPEDWEIAVTIIPF